ncbi:hypothetical protein D3C87_1533790 [compost metagenome]
MGRFVFGRGLAQLFAVALQFTTGTAIKVDFPGAGLFAQQLAVDIFKTIGVAGLTSLGVDVPFQVRAVGLERFAQGNAFGCGIDCYLVDPGAADITVGRVAGTTAQKQGEQRESKRFAHGGILSNLLCCRAVGAARGCAGHITR